jgi:hypothetical protein
LESNDPWRGRSVPCGGPPACAHQPCRHFLCPFCGTSDHRSLHYAFVDGEQDRHRLAICDNRSGRLKIVARISPLSPPGLLVAELASIHLDLLEIPEHFSPDQPLRQRNIRINSC